MVAPKWYTQTQISEEHSKPTLKEGKGRKQGEKQNPQVTGKKDNKVKVN